MTHEQQTREDMIREFLENERRRDSERWRAGTMNNGMDDDVRDYDDTESTTAAVASEEDGVIDASDDGVLISWEGPEFEVYKRDKQWYIVVSVILALIVTYAVIINSPIMAITFILIGVVGYIYIQKDPRHLTFAVTTQGVAVGNELFSFDDIKSFWIFYEPPHTYMLSLEMRNRMLPHIHIPLHQVDPIELRRALIQFVPEKKQEMGLIEVIERLLHI